jgi:hypothetical protein
VRGMRLTRHERLRVNLRQFEAALHDQLQCMAGREGSFDYDRDLGSTLEYLLERTLAIQGESIPGAFVDGVIFDSITIHSERRVRFRGKVLLTTTGASRPRNPVERMVGTVTLHPESGRIEDYVFVIGKGEERSVARSPFRERTPKT